ncbi:hypothetical protein PIB30_094025 [Stylosanthes scabra]|uniref:Uncharacterized protein n=1 Tax=Stylosanthes scabra TaxID=79078 RepID=A0ABU6RW15_9FABA|nr:hypothetical protein [Stylosanthes scabra]
MADQRQTPSTEELFALVTTLLAELQQLRESQNSNGVAHGDGNRGVGGGGDGDGEGNDDDNIQSSDDISSSDDDHASQGSDNDNCDRTPTVRTTTHALDTLSDLFTNHFAASVIYAHDSDYLSTMIARKPSSFFFLNTRAIPASEPDQVVSL